MSYAEFVASKLVRSLPVGLSIEPRADILFPFQRDLTAWALRRGRAAIFAGTGLGKTRMQIEWARIVSEHEGKPTLILAPLAVAAQTVEEGRAIGVRVTLCRDGSDVADGVNVTNYDRLHRFDPDDFGAVVCDESSIIKHHDAKTFSALVDAFANTPYKLCCTATPSPNDYTELGTHAEFLGVCTRSEMLSEFFVHDGGETQSWRLKGHARSEFWRFVSSWGALVRSPADLGYDDAAYKLPPLTIHHHVIPADADTVAASGLIFAVEAKTLSERRDARRASISARVTMCADLVNRNPKEPWLVWCDLNAESDSLAREIISAVEVRGSQTSEEKEAGLSAFAHGTMRALVSKPTICGWGLNFQHCARIAFVGVTDSWEAYFQAVRRCWRFGQKRPVEVHIFTSELEGAVVANLARKDADAAKMADALAAETASIVRESIYGQDRQTNSYDPKMPMSVPEWIRQEEEN